MRRRNYTYLSDEKSEVNTYSNKKKEANKLRSHELNDIFIFITNYY